MDDSKMLKGTPTDGNCYMCKDAGKNELVKGKKKSSL